MGNSSRSNKPSFLDLLRSLFGSLKLSDGGARPTRPVTLPITPPSQPEA